MVAQDFMNLVDKFQLTGHCGLEDVADKLSFLVTVVFLLLATVVVTTKTYVMSPLSCYTPVALSGLKFDDYVNNYCWISGTYSILPNETVPTNMAQWKAIDHLKLDYYQWVPFVLGIMCVFFYLPRLLWQAFCYKKLGVDLENMINKANKIRSDNNCKQDSKPIANNIESILYAHRDYRQGKLSTARRRLADMFGVLVASKRLGTWLSFWYFVMKAAYLANAVGQLVVIARVFGSSRNVLTFGLDLIRNTLNRVDWQQTRVFPRVTFCSINNVIVSGQHENHFVSQCALPQNMFNEKLFLVCFVWFAVVALVNSISFLVWVKRMYYNSRTQFIKKFLKLDDSYDANKRPALARFVSEFLQHDGYFIVHMIYLNCGDLVTSGIVANLFEAYQAKYLDKDLRNQPYYATSVDYTEDNMAVKLPPAVSSAKKSPTAPFDGTDFV